MRWLDEHEVVYERIDVIADEAAFDEMIRLSGQDLAPVIEVDGEIPPDVLAKVQALPQVQQAKPLKF